MAQTVVTKTRKASGQKDKDFSFSKELIPNREGGTEFARKYRADAWELLNIVFSIRIYRDYEGKRGLSL